MMCMHAPSASPQQTLTSICIYVLHAKWMKSSMLSLDTYMFDCQHFILTNKKWKIYALQD